jgi:Exopolysaccharide synthesis, ExoD
VNHRLLGAAAHLRHPHPHRGDPREHLALGQTVIAHHRKATLLIVPIRVDGQKFLQFRLDRLADQPVRSLAQQLRRRIKLTAPTDTSALIPTSVVLQQLHDEAPKDHVTLGWLMRRLRKRSFGKIMLVLSLLATVPGVSIVAGAPLMIRRSR